MISHAGIYSDRGDLAARLRAACPEWTFADNECHARSLPRAIVDDGDEPAAAEEHRRA